MKTIMCYGDSNTFGTNPQGGRWPRDLRWTGKLQQLLGEHYYVIEEGCGGRTTVWNDDLELFKSGRNSLPVALATHKPIDLVIIMLGTNDCKTRFQALPCDIAEGVRQLAELVQTYPYGEWYPVPKVLIVSPIHIGNDIENSIFTGFDRNAVKKSEQFSAEMLKVAKVQKCYFLDASVYAEPSTSDSLHMESDGHNALAMAMYEKIIDIFDN